MKLTKAQQRTLLRLYDRWNTGLNGLPRTSESFLSFRRKAQNYIGGDGCVLVKCGTIWIGIEPDGYAHS